MSKILMLTLACLMCSTATAAQVGESSTKIESQELTKRVGLNIEPLWLILGGIGAKFDLNLSKKIALSAQGIYIPPRWNKTGSDNKKDNSLFQEDTYKWTYEEYNLGMTFMALGTVDGNGLYINPAIGYTHAKITDYSIFKYSGEMSAPQFRTTVGYQWIIGHLRFAAGGGFKVVQSKDIVVKNGAGEEVDREKSSTLGGLAIDGHVGFVF